MRGSTLVLVALVLAGCGSDHAGMSRSAAAAVSIDLTRGFPPVPEEFAEYPRPIRLLGTFPSKTLSGNDAWISIFAFQDNWGPDEACVWVAARPFGGHQTAAVPTIAYGRSGPLHDLCLEEVKRRGMTSADQVVAYDLPRPTATPVPVAPLGPVPPVGYRTELILEHESVFDMPYALRFPATTAPGTWGIVGFVTDADGTVIPRAQLRLWPTGRPEQVVTALADAKGAFAFLNLPPARTYEVLAQARGFLPKRSREEPWIDDILLSTVFLRRYPNEPVL